MADFLGLMKQAAELKSKMETMQAQLDQIEVEGTSGGGLVSVKLSGKGEMKSVKIDDSLIKPSEKEIVEDLIVAAHADARLDAAAGENEGRHRRAAAATWHEIVLKLADRWQTRRNTVGWRSPVEKDVDVQALSAAIAGFLACHILTCRFLVQEGVVDQNRFSSYLETAMAEMAPGIEDKRTLFSLRQLITALRAPVTPKPVQ